MFKKVIPVYSKHRRRHINALWERSEKMSTVGISARCNYNYVYIEDVLAI
jgi:hypothetical protein